MIESKLLTTKEQIESLQKGDFVACEFYRDIHDASKRYRFNMFRIEEVKTRTNEVILKKKGNIYFNYEMFLAGESILKSIMLITQKQD